ncbi:hypothetical protein U0070_007949 [Myodes glareolus]|uniref:Period circadian protein homolog 1-3 PAS-A domain-containing protein n=1 Tax=Myodes glareolus TaxID=447135 RepID=A0AAW0IFM6_MYOGA
MGRNRNRLKQRWCQELGAAAVELGSGEQLNRFKLKTREDLSVEDSFTQECMEEKSFFCRVSVGKHHENEIRYQPFRMTPYLVKVQEQQGTESQLCCLLLAERVHSGYEGTAMPDQGAPMLAHPSCL